MKLKGKNKKESARERESSGETESPGKKKFNLKIAIPLLAVVVVAAAVCVFLLVSGGGDETAGGEGEGEGEEELVIADLPESYSIGVLTFPGVTAQPGEPVEWTQTEDEELGTTSYVYTGFPSSGEAAGRYVEDLLAAGMGFELVDGSYVRSDPPDFTLEEGSVYMARSSEVEGKLYSVGLAWTAADCTVSLKVAEATISDPPPPPPPFAGTGMTMAQAVEYVKEMSPQTLGLDGASMEEYQIYVLSGTVVVDGMACLRINVCSTENPESTNDVLGIYFLSSDGGSLYRLDETTNTVTKLDLPIE